MSCNNNKKTHFHCLYNILCHYDIQHGKLVNRFCIYIMYLGLAALPYSECIYISSHEMFQKKTNYQLKSFLADIQSK